MPNIVNPSKYLGNELEYLRKVLEGESWAATGGSWTIGLEKAFSEKIGTRYGIAFNSGTSTLHAAIEALGIQPGDEVISPAFTVTMDSTATFLANAIPVYCDVLEDTFTMDPVDLEKKITPKTRAIIPVSIYGLSCDMDPIMKLAKKHNIVVIEDDAQAVLSKYKGKTVGTIGHMASFSFENSKHISCGEGGMVLTNDEQYAVKVRKIGGHGYKNLTAEEGRIRLNADVFQHPNYKRIDELGWNYRMSEFNAAVVFAQLERVDELVGLRIKSAKIFMEVMKECDYLIPQVEPSGYENSYYTLGVLYRGDESVGVSWKDFRKAYIDAGGDGIYGAWSIPYLEPMIVNRCFVSRFPDIYRNVHYGEGLCPVAERIQSRMMHFKTNYRDIDLAETKAEILQKVIRNFAK